MSARPVSVAGTALQRLSRAALGDLKLRARNRAEKIFGFWPVSSGSIKEFQTRPLATASKRRAGKRKPGAIKVAPGFLFFGDSPWQHFRARFQRRRLSDFYFPMGRETPVMPPGQPVPAR